MKFVQEHVRNFIDQLKEDFPGPAEYWLANFDETCLHCMDRCKGLTNIYRDVECLVLADELANLFPGDVDFQQLISNTFDNENDEYRAFLCDHIRAIMFAVSLETAMGEAAASNDQANASDQDKPESQSQSQSNADSHTEFLACLSTLRDTALASPLPFWRTKAGEWILGTFYQECLTIDPAITDEFYQICTDAGVNIKTITMYDLIFLAMSASTNTQKYEHLLPRVEEWYKHFGRGTKWWFVPESRYSVDVPGICVPATFFADLRGLVDHPLVDRLEGYGLTRGILRTVIDEMGAAFDRDAMHEMESIIKNLITPDMIQKVVTDIMAGRFGKAKESSKYLQPQEKASRDRLAAKLAKKLADKRAKKAAASGPKEDSRSIDDLVAEIEGTCSGDKKGGKKGNGKR